MSAHGSWRFKGKIEKANRLTLRRQERLDLYSPGTRAWAAALDQREGDQLVVSTDCMPGTLHTLSHLIPTAAVQGRGYLHLTDV